MNYDTIFEEDIERNLENEIVQACSKYTYNVAHSIVKCH